MAKILQFKSREEKLHELVNQFFHETLPLDELIRRAEFYLDNDKKLRRIIEDSNDDDLICLASEVKKRKLKEVGKKL